jgi:TolA-binding protein
MALEFLSDIEKAKKEVERSKKFIFIYFFNPECKACQLMQTDLYTNREVENLLSKYTVPVKINVVEEVKTADEFNIKWFPILFLGRLKKGRIVEDFRWVGYLPTDDFFPVFKLALGKAYFNSDKLQDADRILTEVIENYPGSMFEAEALYWLGITKFKMKKDKSPLFELWNTLLMKYSTTKWAKKVAFIKHF